MNQYELTITLDAKATPAKRKKMAETVEKIVTLAKGKLGKVEDWGEINGRIYLHFPLELEAKEVKGLSTKLTQEGGIIKSLIVRI